MRRTPAERAAAAAVRNRAELLAARRCPCNPSYGESCRYCDGTDEDERDARAQRRERIRQGRRDEARMLAEAAS